MRNRGFTLVEMLVVIGILALLITTLLGVFSGSTESARAVKCLSNMRSLAVGVSSVSEAELCAGSMNFAEAGMKNGRLVIKEQPGWISWDSAGVFPTDHKITESEGLGMYFSCYEQDPDKLDWAFKHGTLCRKVNGNRELFRCPTHVHRMSAKPPAWSYVMNPSASMGWIGKSPKVGSGANPERVLLFAEIPFLDAEAPTGTGGGSGAEFDCVLQHRGCKGYNEYIGFNHKPNKRSLCAHVVFIDSHVEKLYMPKDGLSQEQLAELTEWLCMGKAFSYDGHEYKELKE